MGLVKGMESRFDRVASAAELMSSMAVDAAVPQNVGVLGQSEMASARNGDVLIEMTQVIDGRQFAKATAHFTRDELDRQDRIKLRLAGGV